MSNITIQNKYLSKQINDVKLSKSKSLDIGNFGINCEMSDFETLGKLLRECVTLEEINLGNYIWKDGKKIETNSGNNNSFTKLSDVLKILPKNIKKLHLCNVGISSIDITGIKNEIISKIQRLELSDNKISSVNAANDYIELDFMGFTDLNFLGLSNNLIIELRENVKFPPNISSIFLSNNPISSIKPNYFSNNFPNLKLLDLSGTQLVNIIPIKHINSLEFLYLSNVNDLVEDTDFKNVILHLTKLKTFNFKEQNEVNALEYRAIFFKEMCSDEKNFENLVKEFSKDEILKNQNSGVKLYEIYKNNNFSYSSFIILNYILRDSIDCLDLGNCNLSLTDLLQKDKVDQNETQNSNKILTNIGFEQDKNPVNSSNIFEILLYFGDKIHSLNLGPEFITFDNETNPTLENKKVIQSKNRLSSNNLEGKIKIDFSLLTNISHFHIRKCKLQHFPLFPQTSKSSIIIDLSTNTIEKIHLSKMNKDGDVKLFFSDNKISEFKFIDEDHIIDVLDLSKNKLNTITFKNVLIKHFDLSSNKFESIQKSSIDIEYKESKNENDILLNNNKIGELKKENIESWKKLNLKRLDLRQNPIKIDNCPYYVLSSTNFSDIVHFFEKLKSDITHKKDASEHNRIFKLIVLGDHGVGKTSIVEHLTGAQNSYISDSVVFDWEIDFPRESVKIEKDVNVIEDKSKIELSHLQTIPKIIIKIFDFNYDIYENELHRYWLDSDSVFLIVWNNDSNTIDPVVRMEYWLDSIANASYDLNSTAIFLVQSKVADYYKDKVYIDKEFLVRYKINDIFYTGANKSFEEFSLKEKLKRYFISKANSTDSRTDYFYEKRDEILFELSKNSKFDNNLDKVIIRYMDTLRYLHYLPNNKDNFFKTNEIYQKLWDISKNKLKINNGKILKTDIDPDPSSIENYIFKEILEKYKVIHSNPFDDRYYLCSRYLPSEDSIEDILELFEKDLNEDALILRFPNFYYRKIFDALFFEFTKLEKFNIRHYWRNGFFATYSGDDQSYITKFFVRGQLSTQSKSSIIKVIVQKSEFQTVIYQKVTNFITNLNFRDVNSAFNTLDELFISRLEFSYGNNNNFKCLSEIRLGLEQNKVEFAPFSKFFTFSTSISIAKSVFISYSHNNASYMMKLRTHLATLRRSNLIKDWVDTEILPGDKWEDKIKANLNLADIFIILLSADIMASNYSIDEELARAFEANKKRGTKLVPIYIQPFDLFGMPIFNNGNLLSFEILPKNDQQKLIPVSLWQDQDEAFQVITTKIREMIQNVRNNNF